MSSHSPPVFPLELERDIFEEAAIRWSEIIPSLLLVSHRVYEWIEKIKYRTVTPRGEFSTCTFATLRRAIQSNLKTPAFFRTHVRHLYVGSPTGDGSEVQEILFACAGIQSLSFIWTNIPPSVLPALSTLRPQRLWGYFDSLLAAKDLCQPMFTVVTHLLLFVGRTDIADWLSFLATFPCLTHLTIVGAEHTLVSHILASFKRLEVLVKHSSISDEELDNVDDRYVTINFHDIVEQWVIGARGGNDSWARAERFIAKKRRGEMQPDWRHWIEDADGI
ncbi:hypothetical protein B0H16DRAFT_199941 [Mycena metata]|uniref:Uncharacterized protein n=1 Tax=Mycena metata TaxID=1033252 RepID=A0AAD7I125_9AGAR|nr:hypothetical protein B0H16DRAFT_199941 [Mycena metata]